MWCAACERGTGDEEGFGRLSGSTWSWYIPRYLGRYYVVVSEAYRSSGGAGKSPVLPLCDVG